ncbi:MAG: hypothetical protein ACLPLP_09255 [Mycobacterium sp.]
MDECAAAQAVELIRALRDQLHDMTQHLARLERQGATARNGQASAIRSETAALRRDINEAQILVGRLQRRYLNRDGHAQPRRPQDTKLARRVVPR